LAYDASEDDKRVKKLGKQCPDCICECVSVGRHGSPGRMKSAEQFHGVIIAPTDFNDEDALKITLISHAQQKGMSVLRGRASNDEFRKIVQQRIKKPNQKFYGVASFSCADLRAIIAEDDSKHRSFGDRLAGQVAVSEALFGTIAVLALRTLSDEVRDTLRELRACITANVKGHAKPSDAEMLTLQIEEHLAQLLDQIENLARRDF
jgi:hypothetical protein